LLLKKYKQQNFIFCLQILKTGTSLRIDKKKVDCPETVRWFLQGFGNFFLDDLDIGRFRIAKNAVSPYQSTF